MSMNNIYRTFGTYSGNIKLPTWCISYVKEHILIFFYSDMYVFKKWDGEAWTELIWLRIGTDSK
jgi:hypothetical protein